MQRVSANTTILVVEDNPDHVGLIEAMISRGLRGALVKVALRGQGARRHLRGEWSAYEDELNKKSRIRLDEDIGKPIPLAGNVRQLQQPVDDPGAWGN